METSYTEVVRDLKRDLKQQEARFRKIVGQGTNSVIERTELECLFLECIEYVRRDIMRTRIKTELTSRTHPRTTHSKLMPDDQTVQFEESLLKLSDLNRGKIKLEDFSQRDKYHLLDLFVNNEQTLLTIYDCLFPNKNMSKKVSSQMASARKEGNQLQYPSVNSTQASLYQSADHFRLPKHQTPQTSLAVDLGSNAGNYTSTLLAGQQQRHRTLSKQLAVQQYTAKNARLL